MADCLAAGLTWAITASAAADSLSACRSIAEDAARLVCYDALADQSVKVATPPMPAVDPARAAAAAAQGAAPPPPSPEELFGRDAVQSEDMVRRAAGIGRVEEIRGRVESVQLDPYRKLVLTLDNGQVWSQVDSPSPNFRSGDEVRIRRAAMGSYLLNRVDGERTIRVRRSK